MNIALLTYSTQPRGSVIHTLELATALTRAGHRVRVYALDKHGQGFEQPPAGEVSLVPAAPAPATTDALIQQRIHELATFLAADPDRFDIYHAQDCIGANALLALRRQGQIGPVVRTVHHVEAYQSPYLQACQARSIREPDCCFCVSDRWQQVLKTDYGIDAPRVINGVNLERFSPHPDGREARLRQRYGLTGTPLYLTVGGIEPRKNTLQLLTAFAQVRSCYPQAQLMIAGGATIFDYQDYRRRCLAQVEALGLGRSLLLPGVIPAADLPALYRCADVFCFPSRQEGWGLVVLEAIASGLPVIVSQQPPFTEFLAPDQAFWADPQQADTLAAALRQAIAAPVKRHRVIARSQTILTTYSWPRSAQLHVQQYQQLLATARVGEGSGGNFEF